jgi:TldD protein
MRSIIDEAKHLLLEPTGLNESSLDKVLGVLHGTQIDQADLYFQVHQEESWSLEDNRVKDAIYTLEKGVGIRAISGEKTGFAYSDEIILPALTQAAEAARSITRSGQNKSLQTHHRQIMPPALYPSSNPLESLTKHDKIALLQGINTLARAMDPRVTEVMASLSGSYEVILVLNEEGEYAADIRPLVHLSVRVIAEEQGRREQGSSGGGGRYDYARIVDPRIWKDHAQEAVRIALLNLSALPAPAGTMPVVLGPGWPGVLLHEAVGHGLEGDFNRRGSSAFSNKLGQQVASPLVTIVDDGTLIERRGSLTVDDEGHPTQCTTLIENGILKNYMQDKHNARLMGMKQTGNGRRESYADLPMPRMTNTYMLAGESDPGEIIASVKRGIYAVNFAGGQVDITSGKFVFSTSEAYMIEDGKITHPVKGATLIGNGPEAMQKVSMVGNDLALDKGIGVCGKNGQSVPVGVGQPTLKVDELIVGGTQEGKSA